MKTCWSIISTIVLAVLVILLIAFGGVRLFGLTPYMVTSGSMEPEYPVGSLIYVKEVPPEQIDVGDVITFRLTDGQTVATHQVYEADRAQEEFRTQGINNRDSEGNILHDAEPVKYTSVLGCPVTVIPYLGYYIDGTDAFTVPEEAEDGEIIQELEETFTYLSGDGAQAPSENDEAPGLYEIGIEEEGRLTAKVGGDEYSVVYEPGTLTVRYVTDPEGVLAGSEDIATPVTVDAASAARTGENESGSAADVPADKAFGVVSADTTFRTNGKTDIAGLTEEDETGQIALMCDDILSLGTDIENRVEQMTGRAEEFLTARGNSLEQRQYEYKYLDLINEHDGNAWVSSSEGVDVYYPYPKVTSFETADDTVFTILHFKDLHREYGFDSGETIEQLINDCEGEAVPTEATEQGLKFHVPESGSSPFAVTWQPKDLHTGPVDDGSGDGAEETVAETGDQTNFFPWAVAVLLALAVPGAGGYIRWSYKRKRK